MAALVLVGCTPPEPTEEELVAEAREAFDGFNQALDSHAADGNLVASDLEEYATPELAEQWAQDVQASLDAGTTSRGVLTLVDIELVSHSADQVAARLCTDGRGIETTRSDGSTVTPSALVAWSATFVRANDQSDLLLASLDPTQDQAICG